MEAKQSLASKKLNWKRGEILQPQRRYYLRSKKLNNFKSIAADISLAQQFFYKPRMHRIYDATRRKKSRCIIKRKYTQSCWDPSLSNKWGRLSQSNDAGVEATHTITFIPLYKVPKDRKVAYASFVYIHRPFKDEEWIVRLVVSGD